MSESYEFDHIPGLDDLFQQGGRPGVTYALVAADRAPTFRKQGWKSVQGMEVISIQGHAAVVLCTGKEVEGVPAGSVRCHYKIDRVLRSRLRGEPEEPVTKPGAVFPKPGQAIPEPKAKEAARAPSP